MYLNLKLIKTAIKINSIIETDIINNNILDESSKTGSI